MVCVEEGIIVKMVFQGQDGNTEDFGMVCGGKEETDEDLGMTCEGH